MNELIEKLYFDGFILYPIDKSERVVSECIETIKEISVNNIKDGYFLEKHNDNASDLRPSVKEYSECFTQFYLATGITTFLEEFLSYKTDISTLQLRGAYSGSSYLGWHRDTHRYTNEDKVHGNIPPIFKSIFYPKLHEQEARPTLQVNNGSHIRYFNSKIIDLGLPRTPFVKKTKVYESNDHALVFNTALLHSVLGVSGSPIFRMIASFVKSE